MTLIEPITISAHPERAAVEGLLNQTLQQAQGERGWCIIFYRSQAPAW